MMPYVVVAALSLGLGLAVGVFVGLTIFNRSLQWCAWCGGRLTCGDCLPPAGPADAATALDRSGGAGLAIPELPKETAPS